MKSEKERASIEGVSAQPRAPSTKKTVTELVTCFTNLVDLAEADAREKAIKALCHQSCYGTCARGVTPEGCGKMNAFLGYYDNH